jgi:hypothetical protein
MMRSRLLAGLCVAFGGAAAFAAGWLIWQAPHCRPVAAHAYYTPPAAAQCGRAAPAPGSAQASQQ